MRIERVAGFPVAGEAGLYWLGQAGFWIETGAHRIVIDPYLSDSLARKYVGKPNDHRRMMPPPVEIEALPRPDIVLITHAHTDHMDPETLAPLAARFPGLPFVVPAAKLAVARERIGAGAVLVPVDAGDEIAPLPGVQVHVFAAAHEVAETDEAGRHLFLGYGIVGPRLRIYHSGDCIPFDGLSDAIARFGPDIALLPVNGRDELRLSAGVPGNFTLSEAVSLSDNIPYLVPHHFGMFAFNTIDPAEIDVEMERHKGRPTILRPRTGETLKVI
ncbi:MAG: MBL fold metallo-hydrolase [bacterium]